MNEIARYQHPHVDPMSSYVVAMENVYRVVMCATESTIVQTTAMKK